MKRLRCVLQFVFTIPPVFGGPEQAAHSVCTPPSLPDWPLIRVTLMSLSTKEMIRKLTKIDIHLLFYHILFYTSLTQ